LFIRNLVPPSGGKQVLWLAQEYDFDHGSGFTWGMPTVEIFMTSNQRIPVLAEVQVPYACALILSFSVVLYSVWFNVCIISLPAT
jgi:hypothetical protein